ncbi:FGGY-family carbohydrate kinase [Streptomyces fuscichromogenes]|uniref:Sugar kinase n=1 Tax=Streptomyces fuscichromogenes TaxID=1324013 RepID=A0A917UHX1_9ACTN|nr:FGGY-family carbohydrate kinase [Streptomyces fuscichromogenes]GGM96460.1 sugar kinase [Streptomyces fuscichromogenes]
MIDVVLGVDVGTSSTKGVVVDADGRILGEAVRAHAVDRPRPGHVEMDAHVWWDEFVSLAAELLDRDDIAVRAVGVSGMGPCTLLVDDAGEPVRPAVLYGVDTRAGAQIARLNRELGPDAVFRRCGSALSSQAVGPKLAWIREREPEVWARARRLLMPASWLAHRLTGAYVLDLHSASQCTPLFDIHEQCWIPEWAEHIAPGIEFPPLRWPGQEAGRVNVPGTGIPAGTPVIVGTIDAWSEAISVGGHGVGDLMLMYGTTMFLVNTVDRLVTSPSMWSTVGALPGTRCLAGGMATSGAVTDWLGHLCGDVGPGVLFDEAAASPPGANGLVMLPYFAGERTPVMDPDARGVIAGLTLAHTRGDLMRAALEATAHGVRHNVETMLAAGADIRRIVAVGGGTRGGLWPRIVSDVTGLEQVVPRTTIGASYGAAFLAAGLIGRPDIAAWNPAETVVRPDPATAAVHDRRFSQYRALYESTTAVTHALAHDQNTGPEEAAP